MKKITGVILIGAAVTAVLFGQGVNHPGGNSWRRYQAPYDSKTPPPVTLLEAYSLAVNYLGDATNRFYCVGAECLKTTTPGLPGWTFSFSNTNGQYAYLEVSFDRDINVNTSNKDLLGR